MAITQIKRLHLNGTEFVPITLAEAVVVNTDNLALGLGITTLDKVLRITLGLVGDSNTSITNLNNAVTEINRLLAGKLDKLEAGTGIQIKDGVISTTAPLTLYKIVEQLPIASVDCLNYIYLIPITGVSGNKFKELICVNKNGVYEWEELGTVQTEVDLSGYITRTEYSTKIGLIETDISTLQSAVAVSITAQDITLSTDPTTKVVVNYEIPKNLYDSMVNTDLTDRVVGSK